MAGTRKRSEATEPLEHLQRVFANALKKAAHPLPEEVTSRKTRHPEKRFNVYRNNVFSSLIGVLAGRFPAVQRLLGEEFFKALAAEFIRQFPPSDPVIIRYGADFPKFLEAFPPVDDVPYLPDVARLELAWNTAYHALDAVSLTAEAFAAIPPEAIAELTLTLHPSVSLAASSYPILSIWEANISDEDVPAIDLAQGPEAVMVVRPEHKVLVIRLPPGGSTFISALRDGAPLKDAVDRAVCTAPEFNFQTNLAGLIQNQIITGFTISA